jgi:hypothetical protein
VTQDQHVTRGETLHESAATVGACSPRAFMPGLHELPGGVRCLIQTSSTQRRSAFVPHKAAGGSCHGPRCTRLPLFAQPWRTFRWYKDQRHYPGSYWSTTERAHVIYESRLELTRLLFADFESAVQRIFAALHPDRMLVAQPRRMLLLDHHPPGHPARLIHLGQTVGSHYRRLHRPLERPPLPVRMDQGRR